MRPQDYYARFSFNTKTKVQPGQAVAAAAAAAGGVGRTPALGASRAAVVRPLYLACPFAPPPRPAALWPQFSRGLLRLPAARWAWHGEGQQHRAKADPWRAAHPHTSNMTAYLLPVVRSPARLPACLLQKTRTAQWPSAQAAASGSTQSELPPQPCNLAFLAELGRLPCDLAQPMALPCSAGCLPLCTAPADWPADTPTPSVLPGAAARRCRQWRQPLNGSAPTALRSRQQQRREE